MRKEYRYLLENLDQKKVYELGLDAKKPIIINWDDTSFTVKRSLKSFSNTKRFSKRILFIDGSDQILKKAFKNKNIEAKMKLTKQLFKHGKWHDVVSGFLAFEKIEFNEKEKTVNLPFKSGGLHETLSNGFDQKIELETTKDIHMNDILPIEKSLVIFSEKPEKEETEPKVVQSTLSDDYSSASQSDFSSSDNDSNFSFSDNDSNFSFSDNDSDFSASYNDSDFSSSDSSDFSSSDNNDY